MNETFFISDMHFGDMDVQNYEGRPLDCDSLIISLWNATVSENDTVYVLGDTGNLEPFKHLNGHKILVKGNHDTRSREEYINAGFEEVYPLPVLFEGFFILSHEPVYVTNNAPYANIFGHVHSNPSYRDYSSRSYCVCVERTGYAPVSFEHIKSCIRTAAQQNIQKTKETCGA